VKVIFAGTPEFAAVALREIAAAGHDIPLVLTQPDRPAGRGLALQASSVKRLGLELGCEIFQPATLKNADAQERIRAVGADVMVVAAYGLILPQAVLDMPRLGCLNIHASLLPRWRGAAPIQRAIEAGDRETGICLMQMEAGLDTGPLLAQAVIPISAEDTTGSLHDRLAALGACLTVETLPRLPLPAKAQASEGVTYAAKVDKSETRIDWQRPAMQLERQMRALLPFPGLQASLKGGAVKLWRLREVDGSASAGTIIGVEQNGIVVACGKGALCIEELQKAGGKRLPAAHFLAGYPLRIGECFDLA